MTNNSSFIPFGTLGLFIIDDFEFLDENGNPTGRTAEPQERPDCFSILLSIGGGGTYAAIGARIWLPSKDTSMIVDKGHDFPSDVEERLLSFGKDMWLFRDQPERRTTRALNSYKGEHRDFEYTTPRLRLTPKDYIGVKDPLPQTLHFVCSPTRASTIVGEVKEAQAGIAPNWNPTLIYEPIPFRCVPEELPSLIKVLPSISILSPNAEEALDLLSMPGPPSKEKIEQAASRFVEYGVGEAGGGTVIIRSGEMGAFIKSKENDGQWISAFWTEQDTDKVVDVTGAGNSFLGGLAAGLELARGDIYQATMYATVSASFVIEQGGLPTFTEHEGFWNGDSPQRRLEALRTRHG